ncbi:hypothetical protein AB4186_25170, partial [Vibrio lentus]
SGFHTSSQNLRAKHLTSTPIDQVNLIRTLVSYMELFRNSPPYLYADSHNRLIPVEFHNKWHQHRRNAKTGKNRL